MHLKPPNRKAVTMLLFGIISLAMWYALNTKESDTSWQTFAQKIALLTVGGLLTIFGLKFTWLSMKMPATKAPNK